VTQCLKEHAAFIFWVEVCRFRYWLGYIGRLQQRCLKNWEHTLNNYCHDNFKTYMRNLFQLPEISEYNEKGKVTCKAVFMLNQLSSHEDILGVEV
jgi:hypothetical protein